MKESEVDRRNRLIAEARKRKEDIKKKIKKIWKDAPQFSDKRSQAHDIANALTKEKINIYSNSKLLWNMALQDRNPDLLMFFVNHISESMKDLRQPVFSQPFFHRFTLSAIKYGYIDVLEILIEKGADISGSKFVQQAIVSKQYEIAKVWMKDRPDNENKEILKSSFEEIISINRLKNDNDIRKCECVFEDNRSKIERLKVETFSVYSEDEFHQTEELINTSLAKLKELHEKKLKSDEYFLDDGLRLKLQEILGVSVDGEIGRTEEEVLAEYNMRQEELCDSESVVSDLDGEEYFSSEDFKEQKKEEVESLDIQEGLSSSGIRPNDIKKLDDKKNRIVSIE